MTESLDDASAARNKTDMPFIPPADFLSVAETMRIISICCYIGILVFSAIGNAAIIGIVSKNKKMQTKANVLIVNMAISDLIATICTVPRMIDVAVTSSHRWKIPNIIIAKITCKLSPFIREVSCAVSIFSLVAIAVDRFYAIVLPMARKPSLLKLMILIPMIWIASIIANGFYLYAFQITYVIMMGKSTMTCFNTLTNHQEMIYDTFRFVLFIAGPLLLLVGLYTAIAVKLSAQSIPAWENAEEFAKKRRQQNMNVVKLAVVIVVSFTICWLPYHIGVLFHSFHWGSKPVPFGLVTPIYIMQQTFTMLTYVSFAINPYICLTFSSNFRRSARRTLCRLNPSGRAMSRITTATATATNTRHGPRALSMSTLEVSLANFDSGNATPRRRLTQDMETALDLDLQGPSQQNKKKTITPLDPGLQGHSQQNEKRSLSLCNERQENEPVIAGASGFSMSQIEENEERANQSTFQRSASPNKANHFKETYRNRGFENCEI